MNCASGRYGVSQSDKGSRPVTWVALAIIWTAMLVFATIDSAPARSLGSGAASYAGGYTVPVYQFNMCGNLCGGNLYTATITNFVVSVSSPRPWLVTLNEVCSPEYTTVRDELLTLGYTPDRYISVYVGGACRNYGTAMFTLGGNTTNASIYNLTPYNGEPRALMCRLKSTYAGSVPMCVTHLITSGQNNEAYYN